MKYIDDTRPNSIYESQKFRSYSHISERNHNYDGSIVSVRKHNYIKDELAVTCTKFISAFLDS